MSTPSWGHMAEDDKKDWFSGLFNLAIEALKLENSPAGRRNVVGSIGVIFVCSIALLMREGTMWEAAAFVVVAFAACIAMLQLLETRSSRSDGTFSGPSYPWRYQDLSNPGNPPIGQSRPELTRSSAANRANKEQPERTLRSGPNGHRPNPKKKRKRR